MMHLQICNMDILVLGVKDNILRKHIWILSENENEK
jgi:hypothetical protein